jgi:hypothetical protein
MRRKGKRAHHRHMIGGHHIDPALEVRTHFAFHLVGFAEGEPDECILSRGGCKKGGKGASHGLGPVLLEWVNKKRSHGGEKKNIPNIPQAPSIQTADRQSGWVVTTGMGYSQGRGEKHDERGTLVWSRRERARGRGEGASCGLGPVLLERR